MGWTWQCAKFYDRNGNIDRKTECDDLYTWNNEETGDKCRVLKSAVDIFYCWMFSQMSVV